MMALLLSEKKRAILYPASITDGITSFGFDGPNMFDWYNMNRWDDGILTLVQPIHRVDRGEQFRVEYTEVFNDYTLCDNYGTSCVAVDFLFVSCEGEWNTPTHNITATGPTQDVARSTSTDVIVQ